MDRSMLEHEMAADYGAAARAHRRAWPRGSRARERVRVTTPGGTDCTFDVTGREWKLDDGVLDEPGAFGNLPGRRGLHRAARHGRRRRVRDRPLDRARRRGARRRADPADVRRGAHRRASRAAARPSRRARRSPRPATGADVVAELGIGTNERARITGSVITDEKVLGTAHVAFGDNASPSYGGDNRAAIHVDGVMADATIEADGRVVMARGALV